MRRFYWIAFIIILMDTSVSHIQDKENAAINMSSIPATATFYPDHDYFARAKNAIDGNKQKDNSGGGLEYRNCASTRIGTWKLPLRYLKIDLQQIYYVSEVTLHLRDNHKTNRRFWQIGLTVELTNLSNAAEGLPCGGHYRISSQQSPTFPCSKVARYILITLRNSQNPLQICEVEAFGKVRGCKEPVLHNGKYSLNAGNGIGSQATFTCNIGHKIQGAESAICQDTGQWSKELPLCQPIKCRDPSSLLNGFYSFVDNQKTFGSEVVFKCNANYHLSGDATARCQANTYWKFINGNLPRCNPYCKVSDPANGYVTLSPHLKRSRLPLGTYVTYKCLESDGYLVNGISKSIPLRCTGPGQWSKPIPTCSMASCDPPENPVNGVCTATTTTFGNSKTCSCNHGYRLRYPSLATTTCILKDSKAHWSGSTPSCQLILCHNLSKSSILHGTVIFNGRRYGDTTEYRCNEGYELIGDLKRKCQENDAWTGSAPTCKIKRCKGLSHPKHGSVSSSESRPHGSTVNYTCEPGYQLRYGSSVRECLSTGQWNGTQPICQSICASNQCTPFQECRNDSPAKNAWTCLDPSTCPSELSPVCGTDGVTYNNKCLMKVLSCQKYKNKVVEVAMKGQCRYGGVCSEDKPSPKNGNCRAYLYRYWFNKYSGLCERYVYGSCFDGRNSFYTIEDCQETCIKTDPCTLPFNPGKCTNNSPKYFFNRTSQTCEEFSYGGCFGNENNFKDQSYCSQKCCVCESVQNRKTANDERDAVLLLRITSLRLYIPKRKVARYKAEIVEVCRENKHSHVKIRRGHTAVLEVREHRNSQSCLCPKLRKSFTYKVGVDIEDFRKGTWNLVVPENYYVKAATEC